MKKHNFKTPLIVILLIGGFILLNSFYIVQPDQLALVERFGKFTTVVVTEGSKNLVVEGMSLYDELQDVKIVDHRGLLFKVPFIDNVSKYSSKYRTYTSRSETTNTRDKRKLDIQMYAQYSIVNPAIYRIKVGSDSRLNQLLDENVYPVVIQSANKLTFDEFFNDAIMEEMMEERRAELNRTLVSQYGIEVADIGIYRKNFSQSNIASIEDKMRKEIQKESEQLRAEGDAFYTESSAQTNRMGTEIVAKAKEESAIIRAEAEKEALAIYEKTLTQDVEFYRFIQRMNTFKDMSGQTIFFDSDNAFLKYLDNYNY